MKKKLLLFFALIATFVCLFAITSSATEVDGIYYTFTKTDTYENYAGTATVNTNNRTKGTLTNVVIPETVEYDKDGDGIKEKYVVTAIDGSAFGANGGSSSPVVSVYVPKTVASIGTHVFRQLQYLETVTIDACGYNPETEETSELSFTNAEFWGSAKLTTIDMSKSLVTSLGANMCHGCTSLTTVYLSPSTKSIGDSFDSLGSLTTVTGLENVETFGTKAFYSCALLTGDFVFNKVKSIGENAFRNTSITSVDMSNAPLVTIYNHAFNACKSLTTVKLPDSGTLKTIDYNAFKDSSNLTSMNIPRSLETIGNSAFWGCKFGGDVVLDNLTNISNHAFRGTNITSFIVLDGTITSTGTDAMFYQCYNLETVVLPRSVTSIGSISFAYCNSLKYFVASENITSVSSNALPGNLKAIVLVGDDQDKLNAAATAFGGTLASFATYDPASYPSSRTVYYGVDTKDSVNYYQFDGFDKDWCEWNATTNVKTNYAPVAEALGYSIREKGEIKDGIIAGFKLDPASREAYEKYFGEITLGLFVANAGKFTGNDFIVDGEITNTFGVQLEITQRDYHKVNCTVVGMSEATDVPPLAYALYVLDSEGNVVDYIQKDDYASGSFANVATAGENTLIAVTLAEVEALISKE